MKENRSASQILFGFLPEQTADLRGRIWKVRRWRNPIRQNLDPETLRRELLRLAYPWEVQGKDANFCKHLRQGRSLEVRSLDRNNGIEVESFPDLWKCNACDRLYTDRPDRCACSSTRIGQLPFVSFHDCGAIRSPFAPTCKNHKQARIVLPGTTALSDIRIDCPVCHASLQRGLGYSRCECASGEPMKANVHRAASVYTPRSVVVVNPPTPERLRRLSAAGGPDRALSWVLDGMVARRFDEQSTTAEGLRLTLREQGLPEAVIEELVARAGSSLAAPSGLDDLPAEVRTSASHAAVTLAMSVDTSRTTVQDLAASVDQRWSHLDNLYRHTYPAALRLAGIEAIEVIERFPVLTGNFAYTRGETSPGASHLKPFKDSDGTYIVYGDIAETEALLVRLRPSTVARWLARRGFSVEPGEDEKAARISILSAAQIPLPGADRGDAASIGEAVLSLVHSMSHRFIRRAAVFAGIERNALSELLVPHHLAFLVYASSRGDFVLGGLQAVFEAELHHLVQDVVHADSRCALDPGCRHGGGACMACLHIGEPSCRYFNQFLDRGTLFGEDGFFRVARLTSAS